MCFAPPKWKVPFKRWYEPVPALSPCDDWLEIINSNKYLGSLITLDGTIGWGETTSWIVKARAAFVKLQHWWRRHDIQFSLNRNVCNARVRYLLLLGLRHLVYALSELPITFCDRTWMSPRHCSILVGTSGEQRRGAPPCVGCRRSFSHWGNRSASPSVTWTRFALDCSPSTCSNSFARAAQGWKKQRYGQTMTWRRGKKKLSLVLALVSASRLSDWSPRD